jgi:hypothetical protein
MGYPYGMGMMGNPYSGGGFMQQMMMRRMMMGGYGGMGGYGKFTTSISSYKEIYHF